MPPVLVSGENSETQSLKKGPHPQHLEDMIYVGEEGQRGQIPAPLVATPAIIWTFVRCHSQNQEEKSEPVVWLAGQP